MFSQTIHLPLLSPQPPLCRGKERKRMKMLHTSMKRKCGAKRFKYTVPVEFYGKNLQPLLLSYHFICNIRI